MTTMRENYDIYIKGCGDINEAACAIIIIDNGVEIFSGSCSFCGAANIDGEQVQLIEYKVQFQMELVAILWALVETEDGSCCFYSNNNAVVTWVNNNSVPSDYGILASLFERYSQGRNVSAVHVKKGSNEYTVRCNDMAFSNISLK